VLRRFNCRQGCCANRSTTLRTIATETSLREAKTFRMFEAYNETLCWRGGVNERRSRREATERCACIQGWHGSDCGQPEVVWRAIMASKQKVRLKRRKLARRLVHAFYVRDHSSAIAEVIVEELYPVVDLFVVCDFSLAEDNFRHKLGKCQDTYTHSPPTLPPSLLPLYSLSTPCGISFPLQLLTHDFRLLC
jgi:hypothetical protein